MSPPSDPSFSSPIKAKFFLFCTVFFGAVALLTVLLNLLLGFAFHFNYKWLAVAAGAIGLAWAAGKSRRVHIVHRIGVYGFAFVVLPLGWLGSAGLASPSIVYSLLALVMINYLIEGRERIAVDAAFIGVNMALIALYYHRPELFVEVTPRQQYLDWMANIPLVFAAIAVSLSAFEKAYDAEREQNAEQARELQQLSVTDHLTGLYNRLRLEDALKAAEAGYARTGMAYSVLLLDIDHFKPYNDYYGHIQGDECLRQVAQAVRASLVRDSDAAFRYGGEEFLILILYTDCNGAVNVAERIRVSVEALRIPHQESPTSEVLTVSIGVACVDRNLRSADRLLSAVDAALYRAKYDGRNRIVIYRPA